ncbi:MAG: MmgE/PrpD family protein [Candidatus Limnocylindria bacterium]
MTHERSLTATLADFALEVDAEGLPAEVRHAVRRAILDSVGVAIAGARHPAARIVVDTLGDLSGDRSATLIGSARRADVVGATLANGVMAHVLDWDDTLLPARLHLSATLLPALLASGETTDLPGHDLVAAFAVGFEIQARLAGAISPVMPERGWHGTGVVGGIGVAAAVSRVLGSSALQTRHAMGIAGSAAAGLVATFGSMTKALNLGRAGAAGVHSAQLAAQGFTSHPDLLGTGSFLQMYDDAPRVEAVSEGLGAEWAILENGYKPYPCGVVAHAAIDAALELRDQAPPDDVPTTIHLTVSPETVRLMGNPVPGTGLEGKFSVAYAAVAAWLDGTVLPGAFEDAAVLDEARQALLRIVRVEASGDVAQDEAVCTIGTSSGWTGTAHIAHARGTRARPLDDEELRAKFRIACKVGGNPRAVDLIDAVERIETLDARHLAALLTTDTRSDG